jgi:hypothetical protein
MLILLYFYRNKLDGNDYAVKRIPLNPRNEKLNQKVTREAKLFSKLSNDNVVRYYCAWIEKVPLETMSSISDDISVLRPPTGLLEKFYESKWHNNL